MTFQDWTQVNFFSRVDGTFKNSWGHFKWRIFKRPQRPEAKKKGTGEGWVSGRLDSNLSKKISIRAKNEFRLENLTLTNRYFLSFIRKDISRTNGYWCSEERRHLLILQLDVLRIIGPLWCRVKFNKVRSFVLIGSVPLPKSPW